MTKHVMVELIQGRPDAVDGNLAYTRFAQRPTPQAIILFVTRFFVGFTAPTVDIAGVHMLCTKTEAVSTVQLPDASLSVGRGWQRRQEVRQGSHSERNGCSC